MANELGPMWSEDPGLCRLPGRRLYRYRETSKVCLNPFTVRRHRRWAAKWWGV